MTRSFCNSRKLIKRPLAPAQRRRPDAICFASQTVFRRRRKTCAGSCPITTILLFLPPTAGERNERRSGQCKGRIRKNKSAGLIGENSLFSPLARSSSRRLTPTPFSAKRVTQPFAFHRGHEPKSAVFGSLRMKFLFRPSANSFFEKRVTGKHTKKEFGRT